MRMMVPTTIVLLISGCAAPAEMGEPIANDGPTRLLATMTFMSHAGGGSVSAIPEVNITKPASCTLFREGLPQDGYECTVEEGGPWNFEAPWHVSASFNSSGYRLDDDRRWWEKTIEAYDEAGVLVATWDGKHDYHEDHMRAIE